MINIFPANVPAPDTSKTDAETVPEAVIWLIFCKLLSECTILVPAKEIVLVILGFLNVVVVPVNVADSVPEVIIFIVIYIFWSFNIQVI